MRFKDIKLKQAFYFEGNCYRKVSSTRAAIIGFKGCHREPLVCFKKYESVQLL